MRAKTWLSVACLCLVAGCVAAPVQQYWFHPKRSLQVTSADLFSCRKAARTTSDNQMYSPMEMEAPCMSAKGYTLVNGVPVYPAN